MAAALSWSRRSLRPKAAQGLLQSPTGALDAVGAWLRPSALEHSGARGHTTRCFNLWRYGGIAGGCFSPAMARIWKKVCRHRHATAGLEVGPAHVFRGHAFSISGTSRACARATPPDLPILDGTSPTDRRITGRQGLPPHPLLPLCAQELNLALLPRPGSRSARRGGATAAARPVRAGRALGCPGGARSGDGGGVGARRRHLQGGQRWARKGHRTPVVFSFKHCDLFF